jgi:3-oxoadipate enol-lactonase
VSKTRYVRSGDLRIAYELRGLAVSRQPALLLIQGLGLDRAGWGPAVGPLQRRFRLVLVDNRGSGRSGSPGPFSVADMAGDALAVLDDAGIGAAHVLGASLGGMIAQEFAVRHPDRVRRLVLACTSRGGRSPIRCPCYPCG